MRNSQKLASARLSEMQIALLSVGLGTVSQAVSCNIEMAREARQIRIDEAYKTASKKISAGDRSQKVLADYTRLRRIVSPDVRRVF